MGRCGAAGRHSCSTSHHPHGQQQHSNTAATAVFELVALLLGGGDNGRETLLQHRVSPTEGLGVRGQQGEQ